MILSSHERYIAKRYLLPGRGEAFITLVASISLVAVMLGVAALIIVMSVMNGFRAELFDKTVGINGYAVVQGIDGRLEGWRDVLAEAKRTPGVTSAMPLIEQGMFATYRGRSAGVIVRGMQLEDIRTAPSLQNADRLGSLKSLTPGSNKVAIGTRLAESIGAQIGDSISLVSTDGQSTPMGIMPRIVAYEIGAIFEIGVYDYDKTFVLMPIEDAQSLLLMGDSVGMIRVNTNDPDTVSQTLEPLGQKVRGRALITDWHSMNSQLFDALKIDRIMSFIVLSIIILNAVFNILSSLIMLVRAKNRDIAILRTMGASRSSVMRIFMTVGLTIGSLGTFAGVILGFLFLYFRENIVWLIGKITGEQVWDPKIRYLSELPVKIDTLEVVGIVLMALVFAFLATLYPARKAANTDPVQVLRYE